MKSTIPLLTRQAVYAGITLVCIGEQIYPSPDRFSSVWAVLRCLISFSVLFPAWIWGLARLYLQTWALVGLRPGPGVGPRVVVVDDRAAGVEAKAKDD